MSAQTDNLLGLLEPYGLTNDESLVYLDLLKNGTRTALQLSRSIHIGRTKVYRILDTLIAKELVSQQYDSAGFKFVAASPTQLESLLARKEGELSALRQTLPHVITTLNHHLGAGQPGSKVLYYRGQRGLSQVNYNLLNAHREFLSFEVATAEAYLPHHEAETLREQLAAAKITNRMLTNQTIIEEFTEITDFVDHNWQVRWLDPELLPITVDIFIYNHVYTLCHYLKDEDVFCLEMHNRELADLQRHLFEFLWRQARPLTILNNRGLAKLT